MKEFRFSLSSLLVEKYFSPIRDKTKIIKLLMEAMRLMLVNPTIDQRLIKGEMVLRIDKMSRLFFFTEDKYFSIIFPFFLMEDNSKYSFYSHVISDIDSKIISQVLSIINCNEFNSVCSLDFVEPIVNFDDRFEESFWQFLKELLIMEDGYIRYDFDNDNFVRAKARGEEHKHPENHYDIFYSNRSTFKIGLKKKIPESKFIDLLDTSTNSAYIE